MRNQRHQSYKNENNSTKNKKIRSLLKKKTQLRLILKAKYQRPNIKILRTLRTFSSKRNVIKNHQRVIIFFETNGDRK